jgi:Flp pilus assembly protein TadD
MTDKTSGLFNQVSAPHDFLLAKTGPSSQAGDIKERRKGSDTVPGVLLETFPDLPIGRKFLDHAMATLENTTTFCACAVRIASESEGPESKDPSGILAVAGAIDSACGQEGGIWGMIDSDLFGCFFPEKADSFTETAAGLIREGLPDKRRPGVIIGAACFPAWSFPKDRILENACKAVDHACFFGPDSFVSFDDVSLNISGDKIFQRGDIPAAVEEYKKGLEINDRNINLRNSLGVCYGLLDRLDLAKQEFAAAVHSDPNEAMSLYNLGLIHLLLKDREKALEFFQKARKIDDEVFEVNYHIGHLLLEMGDKDAALPYLDRAMAQNASSAQVHRSYGDYYFSGNQLGDAVIAYKKASNSTPTTPLPFRPLAPCTTCGKKTPKSPPSIVKRASSSPLRRACFTSVLAGFT